MLQKRTFVHVLRKMRIFSFSCMIKEDHLASSKRTLKLNICTLLTSAKTLAIYQLTFFFFFSAINRSLTGSLNLQKQAVWGATRVSPAWLRNSWKCPLLQWKQQEKKTSLGKGNVLKLGKERTALVLCSPVTGMRNLYV